MTESAMAYAMFYTKIHKQESPKEETNVNEPSEGTSNTKQNNCQICYESLQKKGSNI